MGHPICAGAHALTQTCPQPDTIRHPCRSALSQGMHQTAQNLLLASPWAHWQHTASQCSPASAQLQTIQHTPTQPHEAGTSRSASRAYPDNNSWLQATPSHIASTPQRHCLVAFITSNTTSPLRNTTSTLLPEIVPQHTSLPGSRQALISTVKDLCA